MAELFTRQRVGDIGDNFIGVHIGLSAGTGLPYDKRKFAVQLTAYHLIGSLLDDGQLAVCHFLRLQLMIGLSSCLLQDTESMDDLFRHGLDANTDLKILVTSFCLCAPVVISRDLDFAHRIMFDPIFHIYLPGRLIL